jgi:hypothetical protein
MINTSDASGNVQGGPDSYSGISISNGSNTTLVLRSLGAGHAQIATDATGRYMSLATGAFQERMRIDSAGNIGIGTTAPAQALDVSGNVRIIGASTTTYNINKGLLLFSGNDDYKIGVDTRQSVVGYIRYNVDATDTNHGHIFSAGGVASPTDLMLIRGDGKVGIGTTAPGSILDIQGTGTQYINLRGTGSDTYLSLINAGTGGRTYAISSGGTAAGVGAGNFGIWDTTASAARLVINSIGNVGISTTDPGTAKLRVNGDIVGKAQVFQAKMSASYSHPGASWQILPFNTPVYNTLSGTFNPSNYTFTASRAGYYQVSVAGISSAVSSVGDRYAIALIKNGAFYALTGGQYNAVDSPLAGFNGIVYLNGSTDYIYINAFSAIAATWVGGGTNGHEMFWFINYLGE